MKEHSPTPWHTASDEFGYFRCIEKDDRLIARLPSSDSLRAEADAAFIVHAVNAHEELVEMCKLALDHMNPRRSVVECDAYKAIERAIHRAEMPE